MPLTFLKNKLTGYRLSILGPFTLLVRGPKDPTFCLLSKNTSLKKVKKLSCIQNIIWIFPKHPFVIKNILHTTTSIYLIKKQRNCSFITYDQRYLKTKKGLYKLPPVEVDLSTFFFKNTSLKKLESQLFDTQRNSPFYFKGDSLDRLSHPPYLKALKARQETLLLPHMTSTYLFLKKLIDK